MRVVFDYNEVQKAVRCIKPNGGLFEVRIILGKNDGYSGYFKDVDTMINEMAKLNLKKSCNVYIMLNTIDEACYSRGQRDCFVWNVKASTKDENIIGYNWLMIDLDPIRIADVSSSDEELEYSRQKANKIYEFLKTLGFHKPIVAESGNGVHLLYPIRLANNPENVKLIENCTKALAVLFSDEKIGVDTVTANPSRVCKLYGTLAMKGANTPERPHRMSHIVRTLDDNGHTGRPMLEKLASYYPEQTEEKQKYNNYRPSEFDLDAWLTKYGIEYRKDDVADGTRYILDHCPFDESHTGRDAVIFKNRSGAIGFNCFHNSCSGYKWKDVRLKFEPDAYEKRNMEEQARLYGQPNSHRPQKMQPTNYVGQKVVPPTDEPEFISPMFNLTHPMPERTYVKTGVTMLDQKMEGLARGDVSIWSGINGSAKSTLLSQISLNMMNNGNKVGFFSGELERKRFYDWFDLQCAGKENTEPCGNNGFRVNYKIRQKMSEWQEGKFFLYNNRYGNDYKRVRDAIASAVEKEHLDVVFIDNLMALDIRSFGDEKYTAQSQFMLDLHELADKAHIHIGLVAHPRKSMGFIRREDISGSADLMNAADDIFIVHRINRDFEARTKNPREGFPIFKEGDDIFKATNCIEICKDRESGNMDVFIPLWFEPESKRLKNDEYETVVYGWDSSVGVIDDGWIRSSIDF